MQRNNTDVDETSAGNNIPSKSALKRQSAALQKIGEEFLKLSPDVRKKLGLPEDLEKALAMHAGIKNREAARRQRQYIGKLMREIDVETLRQNLDASFGKGEFKGEAANKTYKELKRILAAIDQAYEL